MCSLVSLTSSSPSGEPWAPAVSCLWGLPWAMWVRTMINEGSSSTAIAVSQRPLEVVEPDVLLEVLDVPPVSLVALAHVLGEGDLGVALDRDVVLVIERDQPAESEVPGERGRLARDPLLEVSVGGDHERPVIDDLVARAG